MADEAGEATAGTKRGSMVMTPLQSAEGQAAASWTGSDTRQQRQRQLHDLQMVTDAALAWLGTDDLLDTLLDRIIKIVDADTTTVLLLDAEHRTLVARASRGLEEEVRQGVRIPVGHGFAGSIAKERRPIMIDRVDGSTVTNPLLWELGVQVMLGVPLLTGDEVVGVLHVGRREQLPFTREDAALLSAAADRMAAAIQAERRRQAEAAAELLVDSLVPAPPPQCPGLDFATRYLPAEQGGTGGDWYDLFLDHDANLWIIMGDVAGHGLEVAVTMGRTLTTVRAFASLGGDPASVLEHADHSMHLFGHGVMVTALCAVMPPPYREMHVAVAGHPPPVLAVPGQCPAAAVMPVSIGPPLGVDRRQSRSSRTIAFPDGATALFYTDGLIERRGQPIDAGIDRLCHAVRADEPETVCHDVLRHFVSGQTLRDDVAMVVVRAAKLS
jgi:serine phosphatase RsbU (regulator of sigma subunit)